MSPIFSLWPVTVKLHPKCLIEVTSLIVFLRPVTGVPFASQWPKFEGEIFNSVNKEISSGRECKESINMYYNAIFACAHAARK